MPKRNYAKTNFSRIFKYFLWAIVSAFIFSLITNTYYINLLQDKTQTEYETKLTNMTNELTVTFEEINQTASLLSLSQDIRTVLGNKQKLSLSEFRMLSSAVDALRGLQRTKSFIINAFIVNEPNNIVIGNSGTSRIEEFFDLISSYDNYNIDYWRNLNSNATLKYEVLKPSIIYNNVNGSTQHVLPTIQYASNDQMFINPFVVNIDISFINKMLLDNKLTENSLLFIYDKRGALMAAPSDLRNFDLRKDQLIDIAREVSIDSSYQTRINSDKYLVVADTSDHSDYVFCAVVPYNDFVSESLKVIMMPLGILIIGLIIVTILSYFLSRKIYTPIELILSDNKRLQADLTLAIPYVCERYLMSIFNNNEIMKEEDVKDFLEGYEFSFPQSHFMVIQSVLNFNEDYFETHSRAEYNTICQSALTVATKTFDSLSHSYVFSVGINQICVILNLEKNVLKADIMASIQDYHKLLDSMEAMMTVHSGIGRLYEGYEGMQKSYQESLNASSQITYMSTSMIRTYSKSDDAFTNSNYSIEDENKLVNYLLQGNKTSVFKQLKAILDNNMDNKIGIHALKELYLQLYNTSVRVMNTKEISIYDTMGEDYIDISTHMGDLNPDELHDYIVLLFEKVIDVTGKSNEKYDIANLKEYLETHYCDEIYLDAIAEYFGKSPKYMSKFIKKTLGTTFQDYISSLRINKAKELLLSTKDSINTIAEAVGFNSRHPFMRKFKILEGVTPTEYRKLHK